MKPKHAFAWLEQRTNLPGNKRNIPMPRLVETVHLAIAHILTILLRFIVLLAQLSVCAIQMISSNSNVVPDEFFTRLLTWYDLCVYFPLVCHEIRRKFAQHYFAVFFLHVSQLTHITNCSHC